MCREFTIDGLNFKVQTDEALIAECIDEIIENEILLEAQASEKQGSFDFDFSQGKFDFEVMAA